VVPGERQRDWSPPATGSTLANQAIHLFQTLTPKIFPPGLPELNSSNFFSSFLKPFSILFPTLSLKLSAALDAFQILFKQFFDFQILS
jgi:hypothetical protein